MSKHERVLFEFKEIDGANFLIGDISPALLIEASVLCMMEACDLLNKDAPKQMTYADMAQMIVKHYVPKGR